MSTGNLLVVDGHNLLFRMFYGVPARIYAKDGHLIHGVIGFIGAMLKYIKRFDARYAIVVFDSEAPNPKSELNSEYKATRRRDFSNCSDADNPFSQLDDIKNLLDALNIKHCEVAGCEADDVIASYASKLNGLDMYIVSADSDLLQLVSENVFVFVDRGKKSVLYDMAKVIEKYGVSPKFILDYKALVGDKSDNIRGVPGIGPKTAMRLINRYGCVAMLKASCSHIVPTSVRDKINLHWDQLELSQALIRLRDEVDVGTNIEDLAIDPTSYATMSTMAILREAEIT